MTTVRWSAAKAGIERVIIGATMSALAWLVERVVLSSARRDR